MKTYQKEELKLIVDQLDNLSHALKLPFPPVLHVEALRKALPEKVLRLRNLINKLE